jgi:(p)ppGpp synthase/HD superfamily hydrolase
MDLMQKALAFAAEKHRAQERKGTGLPYIIHPMSVSLFCNKYLGAIHVEVVVAALLHDTIEDTDTTYTELEDEFGPEVCFLVHELTSDKEMIAQMGKNPYLISKMCIMSDKALLIKLCDRLSNVSDQPSEKYKADTRIMIETLLPLRGTGIHKSIMDDILLKLVRS